jgi:hypothetical protein
MKKTIKLGFSDFEVCENKCSSKKQRIYAIKNKGETEFWCDKCLDKENSNFQKSMILGHLEMFIKKHPDTITDKRYQKLFKKIFKILRVEINLK